MDGPINHSSKPTLNQRLDLDFALQAAGLGVWEQDPVTNQVIWDERCRQLFGLAKDNQLSYHQAIEYIHPQDRDRVNRAVQWAMNPQSDGVYDQTYRTIGADDNKLRWVRFWGKGYFSTAGEVYRFAGVAQEVTQQVSDYQKLEESETKLRGLIAAAPAGIGLFVGRELIIENPNQMFIDIVGKGPTIEGLPLREAMPELLTEGQPFLKVLDDVFTTGVPFISPASLVKIVQNGVLNDNYYNISYTPVFNEAGEVYAILDIAIDVTAQVKAQQALAESEAHLQLLRDTVPAMIFYLDAHQRYLSYNGVFRDWFNVDATEAIGQTVREFVGEKAYQHMLPQLTKAYSGQPVGYELHAPSRMGVGRWLSIMYTPHKDAMGQVLGLIVHATDITLNKQTEIALRESEGRYRALAAQLEEEVQVRTEELTASNEELLASYEAVTSTNAQLNEANHLLNRSNDNLQQFAYITSHDLQEPLRKIQSFADLLKKQYPEGLGQGVDLLERMQAAAGRMSMLIQDLLTFSRMSSTQEETVPLGQVVELVLYDLELIISETSAQITVEPLPIVDGDKTQLGQLFHNLLANALKFRKADVSPLIKVRSQRVALAALPAGIRPTRTADAYYHIEVIDNGIGFEQKHIDRIFQVFQRLHGKHEYLGTGMGLAICEKVTANHGGAITATSQPGEGATFSVYLPIIDSLTPSD